MDWNRIKPHKKALKQELNLPDKNGFMLGWSTVQHNWIIVMFEDGKWLFESTPYGESEGWIECEPDEITHWMEITEPFNHIEGECSGSSGCVDYCPSLENK
jgi:hypothetical protein